MGRGGKGWDECGTGAHFIAAQRQRKAAESSKQQAASNNSSCKQRNNRFSAKLLHAAAAAAHVLEPNLGFFSDSTRKKLVDPTPVTCFDCVLRVKR